MIERIRIQNYRSLVDVDVQLGPLTVLIGRSGTGKSNFVRAIRFLRDSLQGRRIQSTAECGSLGNPSGRLKYEITLRIKQLSLPIFYSIDFQLPNSGGTRFETLRVGDSTVFLVESGKWTKESGVIPNPNLNQPVLSNLSGIREASVAYNVLTRGVGCYDFLSTVLAVPNQNIVEQHGFYDNGSNPSRVLSILQDDLERYSDWGAIERSVSQINSAAEGLALKLPERTELQVGYGANGKLFFINVAEESEGFRRYLATLLALYQTPAKQTLIFEHPEHGIHPGAIESLAEEFRRHVDEGRGQIILTTHSPQLLDHFKPEEIRVVEIENQATKIGLLSIEQREAVREKLLFPGELLTVDRARLDDQLAEVPA